MESGRYISEKDYKWQLRNGWIPDQDYVFVSYSSRDWDKVYPCVMALRARGINVYIDIEFMENQSSSWLKNFQERLFRDSGCKGIVTFLSINYMRSYACLVEQMANRTNRMRRHAGKQLPVFYVALESELSTLQQMSAYIYSDEIRRESTRQRVEISPPEYTVLQKFILDSNLDTYRDPESVQELLDDIHDKHDVVINMYDLIFANMKDMPNFQLFEDVEKCAELLTDNFINDKNNSIKLTILENLKREAIRKRRQTAPEAFPAEEPVKPLPIKSEPIPKPTNPEPMASEPFRPERTAPELSPAGEQVSAATEAAPAGTIVCQSCQRINKPGSKFCTKCGTLLVTRQLCRQCGAPLRQGKKFCAKCGAKIDWIQGGSYE